MIDLHTHTTASDGRCSPSELVARAHAAGIRVLSVTDHDTTAGCEEAERACAAAGVALVPGIEVTAVADGSDVHVLGYFIDRRSARFVEFLECQRRHRIDRLRQMIDRLARHGIMLDAGAILGPALADPARAAGRPWIAHALVAGGHAASRSDAFKTWLTRGRPAFVERVGPSPSTVFAEIHEAGGLASLAHPGLMQRDDWIPGFAAAGLDAIEVFHSDHDQDAVNRYLALAGELGLGVSGGSDYHADESHGSTRLGSVSLSYAAFESLKGRWHAATVDRNDRYRTY